MLIALLLCAAVILAVLAALNVGSPKLSLGWAALACYLIVVLIEHWPR